LERNEPDIAPQRGAAHAQFMALVIERNILK